LLSLEELDGRAISVNFNRISEQVYQKPISDEVLLEEISKKNLKIARSPYDLKSFFTSAPLAYVYDLIRNHHAASRLKDYSTKLSPAQRVLQQSFIKQLEKGKMPKQQANHLKQAQALSFQRIKYN